MLKKPENMSSSFDRLILRQAQDEVEPFQGLSPHGELVAVRRVYREAMGDIVFKRPANLARS
jgi:hypothetical protein